MNKRIGSQEDRCYTDKMGQEWCEEFIPNYDKFRGTRKLRSFFKHYIETHELSRPDDFKISATCCWIEHIKEYRLSRGKEFQAEDVFSVRIPDFIKNIGK